MLLTVFLKLNVLAFIIKVTANTHVSKVTASGIPVQSESSKYGNKTFSNNVGGKIIFDVTNSKQYNEIYNVIHNVTSTRMPNLHIFDESL